MAAALEYAAILVDSAPLVVEAIKGLVADTVPRGPAEISAIARDKLLAVKDSEDGAEGRAAFKEKRAPEFKGR
jgi:enoyl-CoA hydratase